uniref:Uncharacterized protein n=1 Tax=Picea sitchensis TaxID=3332 RepID=A9NUQ2_PICSI|nr:unknown [Picea sitchensis]
MMMMMMKVRGWRGPLLVTRSGFQSFRPSPMSLSVAVQGFFFFQLRICSSILKLRPPSP